MRRSFQILIIIFSIFTFSNCGVSESDTNDYIRKFSENKIEFNDLAKRAISEKLLLQKIGYFVNENDLSSEMKQKMENLDIKDINISHTDCDGTLEIELTANWTKKATIYFTKNTCDKLRTLNDYHFKGGMIEVWGLGDGWLMWIDYDFI